MRKHIIITLLTLSLSLPLSIAGDLIAGINFGDSREQVKTKLLGSNLVASDLPKSMFSRIGLNGAFQTTESLKGLKFSLYFSWSDDQLTEITYRSTTAPPASIKAAWSHSINLLSAIHRKAKNAGDYPQVNQLQDKKILYSHEWKNGAGFLYLGVGKITGEYNLTITFSKIKLS